MNDSQVVAFVAKRPDPSSPQGGRIGIYRGSLTPLVEDGNAVVNNVGLNRPVINNNGTVAFYGSTNAGTVLLKTDDGVNFTTVGGPLGNGLSEFGNFAINDAGTVAYRRANSTYAGIFTGPDIVNNKVIATGDTLDTLTVDLVFMWSEGINNGGQIAFWALLKDSSNQIVKSGVYRANPSCATPATDISASVAVTIQGPLKLNKKTGRYSQTVTLKNSDGVASGPVASARQSQHKRHAFRGQWNNTVYDANRKPIYQCGCGC
jgi:hypothetical protein